MSKYKNILVPVDFSDISTRALKVALDLAGSLAAKVTVLHAVSMSAVSLPVDGMPVYNDKMIEEGLDEAREKLENYLREHIGAAQLTQAVVFGEPTSEVNIYAVENAVDMIIMGTHGRTGLLHLLLGSVAESVLRHASVPVLCVPARPE
jgi:nucleotide-binding universal stress UspA family protein